MIIYSLICCEVTLNLTFYIQIVMSMWKNNKDHRFNIGFTHNIITKYPNYLANITCWSSIYHIRFFDRHSAWRVLYCKSLVHYSSLIWLWHMVFMSLNYVQNCKFLFIMQLILSHYHFPLFIITVLFLVIASSCVFILLCKSTG